MPAFQAVSSDAHAAASSTGAYRLPSGAVPVPSTVKAWPLRGRRRTSVGFIALTLVVSLWLAVRCAILVQWSGQSGGRTLFRGASRVNTRLMIKPMLVPIESRRLYRQIADTIGPPIESGEFAPGSLLPPERELAQQLGVSRASVREGLIALEVQGRGLGRVGSGLPALPPPNAAQRAPLAAVPASDRAGGGA